MIIKVKKKKWFTSFQLTAFDDLIALLRTYMTCLSLQQGDATNMGAHVLLLLHCCCCCCCWLNRFSAHAPLFLFFIQFSSYFFRFTTSVLIYMYTRAAEAITIHTHTHTQEQRKETTHSHVKCVSCNKLEGITIHFFIGFCL